MFHSTTQQYHSSFTTQQDTGFSQQRYARPNANRLASHWGNRAAIPFLIAMQDTGSYSSSTRNSLGLFHRQLHSKTLGLIRPLSYCQIPVLVQLEPMNETIDIIHIQPIWKTHGQLLCKDSLTPQVYKSRCFQALSLLNVNRCDQCCQPQFLPTKRQFVNLWPHNFMDSKSKASRLSASFNSSASTASTGIDGVQLKKIFTEWDHWICEIQSNSPPHYYTDSDSKMVVGLIFHWSNSI